MFVKQVMVLSFSAVGFVWIYLAIFGRFIQGPQSSLSGPVDAFMKPQLSKAFDRSLHFGTCTLMVKGDTERKRERERARARANESALPFLLQWINLAIFLCTLVCLFLDCINLAESSPFLSAFLVCSILFF